MKHHGFLIFCALMGASNAAFAHCSVDETSRPYAYFEQAGTLLFVVDDCTDKPANHVYGTVHSDAADVEKIASPAFAAIQQSGAVGFEYISPANATEVAARAMYLPEKTPAQIPNILTREEYQRLLAVLVGERKMEEKVVERMRPWAAAVLMQMPANTGDGIILDDKLKAHAQQHGKTLFGLETMQQQLDIFQRMPPNMQALLLKETLKDSEKIDVINALLQEAYLGKNLQALAALGEESFASITNEELRRYMQQELLIKRNYTMVKEMLPRFAKGDNMVAIGALHLTGKEGVLNLLQQQGYRVIPHRPEHATANRQ